jgi:hypothetical protein
MEGESPEPRAERRAYPVPDFINAFQELNLCESRTL